MYIFVLKLSQQMYALYDYMTSFCPLVYVKNMFEYIDGSLIWVTLALKS